MIVILYTIFSSRFEPEDFDHYMSQIPCQMQQKVLKYRRWQDAQSSLIGKNLLIRGIRKFGFHKSALHDIRYNKYMRPYLPANIWFNISHSGNCVICAICSDFEIGVDVEQIRSINIDDFNGHFNANEISKIHKADDKLFAFYDLWTKTEAIVKADGRGMNIDFKSLLFGKTDEVLLKERRWYLKEIKLDDMYCVNVATAAPVKERMLIEKIYF